MWFEGDQYQVVCEMVFSDKKEIGAVINSYFHHNIKLLPALSVFINSKVSIN